MSLPAFTTKLLFWITTWLASLQPFWLTVHTNTLFPPLNPLTALVAKLGVTTVELPPVTLHRPLP